MADYLTLAQPGIAGLSPYQPGKPVEELERELGIQNIIKLASNENPLGPSPQVVAALKAAAPELARYPDGSGFMLKERLKTLLGIDPARLTLGNGSNDLLELLARVFLGPGLEAIVSEHAFVVYPLATLAVGAQLKVIPAKNYAQDLPATLDALGPSTRMVFIANPNNPTGAWVTGSQLRPFLDQVPEEVIVVLDEAYFEYATVQDYPDGLALLDAYPNLVVTRTFSKAYGLAGLRVGYAASNPEIADLLNRIRQPFNVNALALAGALAALDDQAHMKETVSMNQQGMEYLTTELGRMGLSFIPSAGNFLTIGFGREATPIYEALLHLGVIVRPIGVYGLPQHLRVTVGTMEENTRFIACLQQALGSGQQS